MSDLRNQQGSDFRNTAPQYGTSIGMPTSAFTREMQEDIVNGYFNGTSSAYNKVYGEAIAQYDVPLDNSNQSLSVNEKEELERLRNMQRMIQSGQYDLSNGMNQQQGPNVQTQPQYAGATQPQAAPATEEIDPLTKFLKEIGADGTDTQESPVQPQPATLPQQPTQQQSNDDFIMQEIVREAVSNGVDPTQVLGFAQSLTPRDIVTLYRSIESTRTGQQQRQPATPPINLSEMPKQAYAKPSGYVPQQNTRHPVFG